MPAAPMGVLLFRGTSTAKTEIEGTLLKHRKSHFTVGWLNTGAGQFHKRGCEVFILGDIHHPTGQSLGQRAGHDTAWAGVGQDDLQMCLPASTDLWLCMAVPVLRQKTSCWAPESANRGCDADCSPLLTSAEIWTEQMWEVLLETTLKRGSRKWWLRRATGEQGWSQGLEWRHPAGPEPLLEEKSRGFSLDACFIIFPPTLISSDALQTFGLHPEAERTCPEGGAERGCWQRRACTSPCCLWKRPSLSGKQGRSKSRSSSKSSCVSQRC